MFIRSTEEREAWQLAISTVPKLLAAPTADQKPGDGKYEVKDE
jgi:hypothetical protein